MTLRTGVLALMRLIKMKRVTGVRRMRIGRSRWSGGVEIKFGGWEKQVYVARRSFAVLSFRLQVGLTIRA
jgi:hypothetical protein